MGVDIKLEVFFDGNISRLNGFIKAIRDGKIKAIHVCEPSHTSEKELCNYRESGALIKIESNSELEIEEVSLLEFAKEETNSFYPSFENAGFDANKLPEEKVYKLIEINQKGRKNPILFAYRNIISFYIPTRYSMLTSSIMQEYRKRFVNTVRDLAGFFDAKIIFFDKDEFTIDQNWVDVFKLQDYEGVKKHFIKKYNDPSYTRVTDEIINEENDIESKGYSFYDFL